MKKSQKDQEATDRVAYDHWHHTGYVDCWHSLGRADARKPPKDELRRRAYLDGWKRGEERIEHDRINPPGWA